MPDAGTGTGEIARFLAPRVDRIDAIDWSAGMVATGQQLLGGDHPHLRWICGRMEEVALSPPYALITAGESLHWMEWDVIVPCFAQASTPHALLLIVERAIQPVPWWNEVRAVLKRYASYQARSSDLVQELTTRGFFEPKGEHMNAPHPWCPSVASYLTALHSRSSLSREALGAARLAAFDRHLKKILTPVSVQGCLQMEISARLHWGKVKGG